MKTPFKPKHKKDWPDEQDGHTRTILCQASVSGIDPRLLVLD
jgi:hypothetical protein